MFCTKNWELFGSRPSAAREDHGLIFESVSSSSWMKWRNWKEPSWNKLQAVLGTSGDGGSGGGGRPNSRLGLSAHEISSKPDSTLGRWRVCVSCKWKGKESNRHSMVCPVGARDCTRFCHRVLIVIHIAESGVDSVIGPILQVGKLGLRVIETHPR